MDNATQTLNRHYRTTLTSSGVLLLVAFLAYAWISVVTERNALRVTLAEQGKQLALSLEDTIDVVRGHGFAMQRTVEHALSRPYLAGEMPVGKPPDSAHGKAAGELWQALPQSLQPETGNLHIDPAASLDPARFRRDVSAAMTIVPIASAAHQWNHIFQWSYFYDAGTRWFLIYPFLRRDDMFRATKTNDMASALGVIFDANGTRPLERVGPRNNPGREMVWIPPYQDTGGKGWMVTLLAPVYLGNEFVGAVGTDVTLSTLQTVLRSHAPGAGRALVIDDQGTLLADTEGVMRAADGKLAVGALFPELAKPGGETGTAWLRFPLRGTSWRLLIHLPEAELDAFVLKELAPSLAMAGLLFAALLALAWIQNRRYAGPALQLAEYVARVDDQPDQARAAVPGFWLPLFERISQAARERRDLLRHAQAQAEELEGKVEARTAELREANAQLSATVASLEKTQHDLVRADKLGTLGALVAGVSYEIDTPLQEATAAAADLRESLSVIQQQQKLGLRKADLDAFMARAGRSSEQLGKSIDQAADLVQRFRQVAVDQSSEVARRFSLREVVGNVLAVLQPAIKRCGVSIDNHIADDIEMHSYAGTLGQVLNHVVSDALSRSAAGQPVALTAGRDTGSLGEMVELTVSDRGASVTGGSEDDATGGLAIAARLVEDVLGGQLHLSASDAGNQLIVRIPKAHD